MPLFTSTSFASTSASGTDWRDTSKKVLEQLESVRQHPNSFNLGFLYISDHLAEDATSIFNLFKSVLKIDNWVGSVGMGVIGCGKSYVDMPAISAMVGKFPEDSFCVFPTDNNAQDSEASSDDDADELSLQDNVKAWLASTTPMLTLVHGDPMAIHDPQTFMHELESTTNSFLVGGLTSSRSKHYQIANAVRHNAVSGVFFADSVPVATTLSQGCAPISELHTITKSDEFTILELDDRRALDVFQDDLRILAAKKLGKKPDEFLGDLKSMEASDYIPKEFKSLFKGQVHVALPFSQSDQKDYMVRNITGIDPDEGSISISENVTTGAHITFVERDEKSVAADLSRTLVALRKRVQAERGCFEPKAALYVSCVARGFSEKTSNSEDEMHLIKDIIGDIPLTGFYAGGEINNARLYGYTGVLTLFF
ncbi:MAG: histidine kinase [Zetaproteobacteria bacterium]|nr:MAG: histidine kinase [Zetaproteobacteria bacterium]